MKQCVKTLTQLLTVENFLEITYSGLGDDRSHPLDFVYISCDICLQNLVYVKSYLCSRSFGLPQMASMQVSYHDSISEQWTEGLSEQQW
jgi:hypothetical protein